MCRPVNNSAIIQNLVTLSVCLRVQCKLKKENGIYD